MALQQNGRPAVESRKRIGSLVFLLLAAYIFPANALSQVAADPRVPAPLVSPQAANPPPRPGQPPSRPPPSPQLQAVLGRIAAAGLHRPAGSVEELRRDYLFYTTLSGPSEPVSRVEDQKIPGPAGNIPIRLYAPRRGAALPVWVFFHGGGFVAGSLDTHDSPLRAVANRCDCLVVSVGYRLAPEHPYPAGLQDAYAATKWVADHAEEIGGDPKRIAVGGDGAGGNLAAAVALMAHDRGGPHLVLEVLISPILDSLMGTYSWVVSHDPVLDRDSMVLRWSFYLPVAVNEEVPYISPARSTNLKNLPSTFIVSGTEDPVRDTVMSFVTDLMRAGVPVKGSYYRDAIHSFFLMAGALDAAKKCIDETGAVLKETFGRAE
jgi:acetyl esterase